MSYTRYWATIHTIEIKLIHIYTSDIHPAVHVVYTVLGHIQALIHSLYTFIHQTYTLYMSYTYWVIHSLYTFIHIRPIHTMHMSSYKVLGHIQPVIHTLLYTFIHQTFTLCTLSYTLYCTWNIFINHWYLPYTLSPCTFINQTYTLHMSHTRYWAIFNHWYIAYTLLYITHTTCTCLIRRMVLGHIQPGDT